MKNKYFILTFIVLIFNYSFAQKEASHWYFGNFAGLDFSSGNPVADTNGSLNTLEGCATISDVNGDLLFYTDGTTVWNRNHSVMPTGFPLEGDPSSSQSAIIVPKPNAISIYYIFTVDWSGGDRGLNYYTVDMTLNGGLGDVIGLNNIPTPTNLLTSPTSEKITAVKVLNEDAFWVISLRLGSFYAFKVDASGVNSKSIISSGFNVQEDLRGYLKVSPNGSTLVSANMTTGTFMYDFDAVSGVVTNERGLDLIGQPGYGVEFSALSKKVYISTGNFAEEGQVVTEMLFQFTIDISNQTAENINATRVLLYEYENSRAALQIGLDGKIYRNIDRSNFLGVITNPDGDGIAANYLHNAVSLGDKISTQGLPPFIQSFFIATIGTENICFGDSTNFAINSNEPILSITWNFGDGSPTSAQLAPIHTYAAPGDYTITAEVITADETKNVTQVITIYPLPSILSSVTLQQCDDDTDGMSLFNLKEVEIILTNDDPTPIFSYHLTEADAEANTNTIVNVSNFSNTTASQVFVRAESQLGCYDIATVNLQVSTTAIPTNFMLNFNSCDNDVLDNDSENGIVTFDFSDATNAITNLFPSNQNLVVTYYETIEDALAEQNNIDATNYRNENSAFSQQIVVRVDSQLNNACLGLGFHISLSVKPLPQFEVPEIEYLCSTDLPTPSTVISVLNPLDSYTYEWRNENGILLNAQESNSVIEVFEAGDYFVTATSQDNCTTTKKISVVISNFATIENVDVIDDSENNMITVQVTGDGDYEFALDDRNGPYQDENIFENVFAGIHTVFIRDKNGCGYNFQQVSVIGYPRFFTPNGDGFNDTWQVLGASFQPASKIYIFDRFGKLLVKIDPIGIGWDGTYRGRIMPESDYWFMVQLEDGRTRRGHFSLIKR